MPRLEYFVVSERVSVDQTTNEVSVFSIFEEIATPGFPTILPNVAAVTLLLAEEQEDLDADHQLCVRIKLPNAEQKDFRTNFKMQQNRHRLIQRFVGVVIPGPGRIEFEVSLDGDHKASHFVDVKQVDMPMPQ